jgi:hypothetical protein
VKTVKISFSSREIALCATLAGLGFTGNALGFRIPISSLYSVSPLAASAQVLSVMFLSPLLAPVVFFMCYLPLPGVLPYSLAYCPAAAFLSFVYYTIKNKPLKHRVPLFAFAFWVTLNLANLLDTYIESAVLGWFPMSAYWYWYFSWLLLGGWIHTAVVPSIIIATTLKSVDKRLKPDWLDQWRKKS